MSTRKRLNRCCEPGCGLRRTFVALLLGAGLLGAQFRGFQAASVAPSAPVSVKPGAEVEIPLTVRIRSGYHINSDTPAEDYLIPTQVVWDAAPFRIVRVEYPDAEIVRYPFSEKPLSVYSGEIEIVTVLEAPAGAKPGETLAGRLHYQACNDKACLAPTSIDISVPLRR